MAAETFQFISPVDYRKQRTPEAPKIKPRVIDTTTGAPTTPDGHRVGAVLAKEAPPSHEWPTVATDLPDGTLVRLDGLTVGQVEGGIVQIAQGAPDTDRAHHLIRQGMLTKVDEDGNLS